MLKIQYDLIKELNFWIIAFNNPFYNDDVEILRFNVLHIILFSKN